MFRIYRKLIKSYFIVNVIVFFVVTSGAYASQTYFIEPSDDGLIFSNGTVLNNSYVSVGDGGVRGVIEFPLYSITAPITEAFFVVNPYGLPIHDVDVYGYASNDGVLTSADYNVGIFLGTWSFPNDINFGQDVSFNVTAFLSQTTSTHVGFNLRNKYGADLSSLEVNYGHPSQLQVTVVPEPLSSILFLSGGSILIGRKYIRRKKIDV